MQNEDWKAVVNYVRIDPDAKDWIVDAANQEGMSISDYAGLLLEEAWERFLYDPDPKKSSAWDHHWFVLREKSLRRVTHAAAQYIANPSPEARVRLDRMCGNVSMDTDEVIADIEENLFAITAAKKRANSKRADCIMWLFDLLNENDGQVDASVVYEMALERGFSGATLNRSKGDINNDPNTPSIESTRDGPRHVWKLIVPQP